MVVIVDNGREHSLHALYFVEAESIAQVEDFLRDAKTEHEDPWRLPFADPDAKVVGTCENLAWLPPYSATQAFEKWAADCAGGAWL